MLKQFFNYYIVLKSCWIILLFQFIGFIAFVVLDQGRDIIQALNFTSDSPLKNHTWFMLIGATWWSWQSWRAARITLHFTTFNFMKFNSKYALRAQVLIPRFLGILPLLIMTYGLVSVSNWTNPLVYINICLAFWLYLFYHLRKDIIVLFLSRNKWDTLNIPDYVQVKNKAYPAKFIWAKQGNWILFRLSFILIFFIVVILYPVNFPQYIGASSIILYALGAWLVLATFISYAEKRFKFPFSFTLIVMVIIFSFFNNNHEIRTLNHIEDTRLTLEEHFDKWYQKRAKHTDKPIPIFLIAGQGGGVRSAYWTAQVLADIQKDYPSFDNYTYAYSTVSGGSLGVATYKGLLRNNSSNLSDDSHTILSKDFLAPVTSWLVVPDLFQKFIPFPLDKIDRAKALEYSWEQAATYKGTTLLSNGFLETYQNDECMYLFNSTRVENGYRTLISNVKIDPETFSMSEDFFDVTNTDIPISTAVSLSSRFPFITPPGLVIDKHGEKWGHLVDGGYIENMGATAMLELYDKLRAFAKQKNYSLDFKLIFIKNNKQEHNTKLTGMHEILGPLNTFSKVWVNSGSYDQNSTKLNNLHERDEALFVNLRRNDDSNIPLGWFLSPQATRAMQNQVRHQTSELKNILTPMLR